MLTRRAFARLALWFAALGLTQACGLNSRPPGRASLGTATSAAAPATIAGQTIRGLAYGGIPNPNRPDLVRPQEVVLEGLAAGADGTIRLTGALVEVVNGGVLVGREAPGGRLVGVPMGNAVGSVQQGFPFRPRSGGPLPWSNEDAHGAHNGWAVEAARFGEVNTYYHAHRALAFANDLLSELGERPLPFLRIVVNAHSCSRLPGYGQGDCDGRGSEPEPFRGGHYRLPSTAFADPGFEHPVAGMNPTGEIHLGQGNEYIADSRGMPVVVDGHPYARAASHNPGIIVHEVGHHVNAHTADFRANRDRDPTEQSNRKIHLDEGTADYWAAAILDTPDIFNWQRAAEELDDASNRDLRGPRTTADFVPDGDPHRNGNIWSSALWDLRRALGDPRRADLLVMKMLVMFGRVGPANPGRNEDVRRRKIEMKDELREGLAMLLDADEVLHRGRHRALIQRVLGNRGINPRKADRDY